MKMKKMIPICLICGIILPGIFSSCGNDKDPSVSDNGNDVTEATPYITRVIEYMPAPGQFVNSLPEYEEGDTQEDMNRKVLEAIGNGNGGMISLGGYGGYVIVGFDHRIENKEGLRDFRVLGNAFSNGTGGGSYEPGIIQVALDEDADGVADQWFEIAGSAHQGYSETWYETAQDAGNDINFYSDYRITYYAPDEEPEGEESQYIRWTDNLGAEGYISKNIYHTQVYYPQWVPEDSLTFNGSRLPQNGIKQSETSDYYLLYPFTFGYADNAPNTDDESAIDIDWATDSDGNPANLPGIDLIRIYTGVNQMNGWIGECSTEIMGVEDLHLLGEEISTR